jgi:hypothetical protein
VAVVSDADVGGTGGVVTGAGVGAGTVAGAGSVAGVAGSDVAGAGDGSGETGAGGGVGAGSPEAGVAGLSGVDVAGSAGAEAGLVDSGCALESDWLGVDGFVGVSIVLMPKILIYRTERPLRCQGLRLC